MTLLHDAYTALLSNLTTRKNDKEIWWEDENGYKITVEPVDIVEEKYIVRGYYINGNKWWEAEYQNGQKHGKSIEWYENGKLHRVSEYQNGQPHGNHTAWYKNGNKRWETEYQNGKLIKC